MSNNSFVRELEREISRNRLNDYSDNFDHIQLGPAPRTSPMWRQCGAELKQRLKELAKRLLQPLRPYAKPIKRAFYYYFLPAKFFKREIEQYQDVSLLYDLLADDSSRYLLVKLFAYRILGYRKVKLPRNYPQYWRDIESIDNYRTDATPIKIRFMDASLALYDLSPLSYKLRVYASGPGIACAFVQKQYEYHSGDVHCKTEAGDIAIDAGGCWGETTMYFAHEVGPSGKVVSFEFVPSNLAVMRANQCANEELAKRVALVEKPIWSYSGLKLYYVDWGPGSRVTEDENKYGYDGTCETVSIDDIVKQLNLPRVDFIKMDIEGAEFPALRGAERTIRTYCPKLAISVYHQLSDFVTIPRYLADLKLGYKFYLDHHTIYQNETVLFAVPPS